jgi:LAGLIDADG endonuclease
LSFKITQDTRNSKLLINFVQLFGCGGVYNQSRTNNVQDFMVTKFSDITEKIIPFFETYPLRGAKPKDFLDFKLVAELMKSKAHLTKEGLDKIRVIKLRMNSQRNEEAN